MCFYGQPFENFENIRDFQQCGISISVDSDEHVQHPFKLRKTK